MNIETFLPGWKMRTTRLRIAGEAVARERARQVGGVLRRFRCVSDYNNHHARDIPLEVLKPNPPARLTRLAICPICAT